MRTEKWLVLGAASLLIQLVACERGKMEENAPVPVSARIGADSTGLDSIHIDSVRTDSIGRDTIRHDSIYQDTIVRDSIIADSSFLGSLGARRRPVVPGALERLKSIH